MAQRGRKASLSKLQEKQAEIATQIKVLKRDERREAAKLERLRFSIIGQALAKELAENADLSAQLAPIIDRRITKSKDRALLGLPALKKSTAAQGQ